MVNFDDAPLYYIPVTHSFRLNGRGLAGKEQLDLSVTLNESRSTGLDLFTAESPCCCYLYQEHIHLVYRDQKTVGLIRVVKRERSLSVDTFSSYQWLFPVPGLFHWRTNAIDLIHNTFSGDKTLTIDWSLPHNAFRMGIKQGHQDPFHYKEQLCIRSFHARVLGMFYDRIQSGVHLGDRSEIDGYVKQLHPETIMGHIKSIRQSIFTATAQNPIPDEGIDGGTDALDGADKSRVDKHFLGHCCFSEFRA
jgi:hypothetical protein